MSSPESASCSYFINVHNARMIVFYFTYFESELFKDDLAYGTGYTVDVNQAIGVFQGNLSTLNALPKAMAINITMAPLWFIWKTDKTIPSPGWELMYNADVDDCLLEPCLNGGTCEDLAFDYMCTCPLGFTGRNCETNNRCSPSPCQQGGTCTEDVNGYYCTCPPRWSGTHCERERCVGECHNGGTCNSPECCTCTCPPGYGGSQCDQGRLMIVT
ncbi:fibropellin-3-like [Amphiura filiformis]|uniref:fibropellin-3-like n=1 Tax=Amphiura filiformis TaxID=82378 RepID=UPI003B212716